MPMIVAVTTGKRRVGMLSLSGNIGTGAPA
jgi:hypothetical protein